MYSISVRSFKFIGPQFEIMVLKLVKITDFQKRSPHDFLERRKKWPKNPAKFQKPVKYRVTSNGHNSMSFDARKKLKVSA